MTIARCSIEGASYRLRKHRDLLQLDESNASATTVSKKSGRPRRHKRRLRSIIRTDHPIPRSVDFSSVLLGKIKSLPTEVERVSDQGKTRLQRHNILVASLELTDPVVDSVTRRGDLGKFGHRLNRRSGR